MKTIRIFFKLCELNLKRLLAYRTSFLISLVLMSVWVAAYVSLIEVIFLHTNTLAGWNKGQVLLIMAMYYLIQNLSDIFFKDNFEDFGETLRRGELDFKIVKPVSTRLLSFFWEMRFDHCAGLVVTGFLFSYAIGNLSAPLSFNYLAVGILMVFFSLLLYFSILSIIGTFTFWIHRNDTFNVLIFHVSQLSRYPRQIYKHLVGKILTFGIPLALIASIPAEIALEFNNGLLPLFFIGISIIFTIVSWWFWGYGLKHYTSAN